MSRRYKKHCILPPDNISDWFKLPVLQQHLHFPIGNPFNSWLYDETAGKFYYTHSHIYFENEEDAVMYALRWM
jgi:hypothetical protein